jgi:hypothetical protein
MLATQPSTIQAWLWCQRCHRCYQWGDHRRIGANKLCAYVDCGATFAQDSKPWLRMLLLHPEYPRVPRREVAYSQ